MLDGMAEPEPQSPTYPSARVIEELAREAQLQQLHSIEALDTIMLDPTHKHAFTRESFRHLLEAIGGWEIERLEVCRPDWSFLCVARKCNGGPTV